MAETKPNKNSVLISLPTPKKFVGVMNTDHEKSSLEFS
jgi:hypothetical protein